MGRNDDLVRFAESVERMRQEHDRLLSGIRELQFSVPRIDLQLSTATMMRELALSVPRLEIDSVARISAELRAQMSAIVDRTRSDRLTVLALVPPRLTEEMRKAKEFQRSLVAHQISAAREMSDLARLVASAGLFSKHEVAPPEPAPRQLDRIEERVAAIEETLKAAFTPEEEPTVEEDDRPWPGQYL
jgi:hypothetical protein